MNRVKYGRIVTTRAMSQYRPDHNRTPAYLKAVNSGRRVRFADEVCGSLGTELDRTTYQDSTRLPDYAPPSIQTKCGLHSQDLDGDGSCIGNGYISSSIFAIPSGANTWQMACSPSTFTPTQVTITATTADRCADIAAADGPEAACNGAVADLEKIRAVLETTQEKLRKSASRSRRSWQRS